MISLIALIVATTYSSTLPKSIDCTAVNTTWNELWDLNIVSGINNNTLSNNTILFDQFAAATRAASMSQTAFPLAGPNLDYSNNISSIPLDVFVAWYNLVNPVVLKNNLTTPAQFTVAQWNTFQNNIF